MSTRAEMHWPGSQEITVSGLVLSSASLENSGRSLLLPGPWHIPNQVSPDSNGLSDGTVLEQPKCHWGLAFISKKVLSGLFPQARLLGGALAIAVATLLPALPRISLGWAAPETVWDGGVCHAALRMIDVSSAIFNSWYVGGEPNACLHLQWTFCVMPGKMESGLVNAAPGLSSLCQSPNGTHDPHRGG